MHKLFSRRSATTRAAGKFTVGALVMVVFSGLQGCVTASGPTYPEYQAGRQAAADQARLTIFRQKSQMLGARSARLMLDGEKVAGCEPQGFASIDTLPGSYVLSVDLPDGPGACKLPISVQGGGESFYEVKPRPSAMKAGLVFGLLGQLIESAGKECGGAFSIEVVDSPMANALLPQMRLSEGGVYPTPSSTVGDAPGGRRAPLPAVSPAANPTAPMIVTQAQPAAPVVAVASKPATVVKQAEPGAVATPAGAIPSRIQPSANRPVVVTTAKAGALNAGDAHAAQATVVRVRPKALADIAQAVPAGAPMQLQVRQINGDGAWWFVEYQGATGWVSENGLIQ